MPGHLTKQEGQGPGFKSLFIIEQSGNFSNFPFSNMRPSS